MLKSSPELEAKALFEWLCEQKKGRYAAGHLRTFQRRVERWRGLHQSQIATLDQVRAPREAMQVDGTWMTELEVTIVGEPFKHLLIHCVLPYSNWEWGRVEQSESLSAVRLGLQTAYASWATCRKSCRPITVQRPRNGWGSVRRRKLGRVEATRWAICRYSSTMG
ncbi:MAG: hypothetical protein R3A44_10355 [Caldilineaceae bacterium]